VIKIELNKQIRVCDHCGATNIKRTYCIYLPEYDRRLYIGRICISRITDVDTSGNPSNAARRLQHHFKTMNEDEVLDLVDVEV